MLQTLRVKNLAIVENITVEFGEGLNVVTGETGAGKSIIIGALGLILGERSDKELIRSGEDKCGVEAAFHLRHAAGINGILDELELPPCDDGRLVLRRIVAASGSSKILINDAPSTVQALKRIGDLLIDMHGPHDHQSLLGQGFQMDVLDSFGELEEERCEYAGLYRELMELEARRKALECDDVQVEQQIDMLKYQVKEIEEANLTGNDEGELEREHNTVANAQNILMLAQKAQTGLSGDESSAFNGMVAAQNALNEMSAIFPEASEWLAEARSIAVQIQELAGSISSKAEGIEGDPARLQWLDDRLALVRKLKRKYGGSIDEVHARLLQAKVRLEDLETRGRRIAEIDGMISGKQTAVVAAGKKLGKVRRKAGEALAQSVTRELRELGFPHSSFDVTLAECAPGESGMDEIEFGFAPNVGEPMRAMRAIASSGEISRVMLAIKTVLSGHDKIPVLVFDEIDANVGGEMGNAVGAKLAAVSGSHQVLCITHLPQVAIHGDHHYVVSKEVAAGRTRTGIKSASGTERVEEIARMLGGRDLTSVTLKHAREMLELKKTEKSH